VSLFPVSHVKGDNVKKKLGSRYNCISWKDRFNNFDDLGAKLIEFSG
jgi:hypothetical protein